jgi:hypothetical protein
MAEYGAYKPRDVYTLVAEDLAYWLEDMSDKLAMAMSPQGVAPFAAALTEDQKVTYYRNALFTPDGQPNLQGRTDLLNRLGPQGFRAVYTAVINAYPQLRIPTPPIPGQPPMPGSMPPPAMAAPPPGTPPAPPVSSPGGPVPGGPPVPSVPAGVAPNGPPR